MNEERPTLTLVKGHQTPEVLERSAHRIALRLVREAAGGVPLQLSLPFVKPARRALLSIGWDGLDFSSFAILVKGFAIKQVVDVRASPSFWGHGFSRSIVLNLFRDAGVNYDLIPELGHAFVAYGARNLDALVEFREYVKQRTDFVSRIAEKVIDGPLLLVSRSARHRDSERAVLVEELARTVESFDLHVIEDFEMGT